MIFQIERGSYYVLCSKLELQEYTQMDFDYEKEEYFNFLVMNRPVYRVDEY